MHNRFTLHVLILCHLMIVPTFVEGWVPRVISEPARASLIDLTDFSRVGYHEGVKQPPYHAFGILNITDYGVEPGSDEDLGPALTLAIDHAAQYTGLVIIELPPGDYVLRQPVTITRRGIIIRGSGSGLHGTTIVFQQADGSLTPGFRFEGKEDVELEEVGLENLRFIGSSDSDNAIITFRNARNCWSRNLSFKDVKAGIRTDYSHHLSLTGLTFSGSKPLNYPILLKSSRQILVSDLDSNQEAPSPLSLAPATSHAVFSNCQLLLAPGGDASNQPPAERILIENTRFTITELMQVDPESWSYAEPARYAYFPLFGPDDKDAPVRGRHHVLWNVELDFQNQQVEGELELNETDPQILLTGVEAQENLRVFSLYPSQTWILALLWQDGDHVEGMNRRTTLSSLYRHQRRERLRTIGPWNGGFLNYHADLLARSRAFIAARNSAIWPAWETLREAADEALTDPIRYVTEKEFDPPSGDRRDYVSQGTYWWPDPESPDGLPYIVNDGVPNPERLEFDTVRFRGTFRNIHTLSLAYTLSGNEAYAARAVELLQHWFLHPQHGMNPNMKYGQSIPGRVEGRGIGILESREFAYIQDIAAALDASPHFSPLIQAGLRRWFTDYLDWIWNHKFGGDERIHPNNHGSAYDPIAGGIALFVDDADLARELFLETQRLRIDAHIKPDGRQPQELWRTLSFSYSQGNLWNMFQAATMAQKLGIELFHYQGIEGQSLRTALDYLIPFGVGDEEWPYEQIRELRPHLLYRLLLQAAWHYQDQTYLDHARELRADHPEIASDRSNLLFPLLFGDDS